MFARLICMALLLLSMSAQAAVSKVISFGDSLSDNGNVYALTKLVHDKVSSDIPIFPLPPYYKGRYSNGFVWSEYLTQKMGLSTEKSGFESFAYASSWAESPEYSHYYTVPDIVTQIDWYLMRANPQSKTYDPHLAEHLYTFWDGSNDYLADRNDDLMVAAGHTVTQIEKAIHKLINWTGAKRIVVLNVPDLGRIPLTKSYSPAKKALLSKVSRRHNELLERAVRRLRNEHSGTKIVLIDVFGVMTQVMDDLTYDGRHFSNVTDECYRGIKLGGFGRVCRNPDEYMFWDDMHPTRMINQLLADHTYAELVKAHALH